MHKLYNTGPILPLHVCVCVGWLLPCRAMEAQAAQLRGSISEGEAQAESSERDSRLGFTIWTTSTSTATVLSTSIDSATTVTLSYQCTAPAASLFPAC